ncbi:uncharacterized protein LOC135488379 [Lineus longissimus]|uniref:uncharacterized protein LOC135488379 n=1 Tax=Lineus longissimus TaxID=88925 RepID=UPI002B4FAD62
MNYDCHGMRRISVVGMANVPLRMHVEGHNVSASNGVYCLRGWTGCDFFQSQPLYQSEADAAMWIWWDSKQCLFVNGNTDGRYGSEGFSTARTLEGNWTSGCVTHVGNAFVRFGSPIPLPPWVRVSGMSDTYCNGWYCLDETHQGKPLYHKAGEPKRCIWYNVKDGFICGHPDNCHSRVGHSSSANLLGKWREGQVEIV